MEHDGVPDDSAYRPAMPCEMHSPGPQRTLPSTPQPWGGAEATLCSARGVLSAPPLGPSPAPALGVLGHPDPVASPATALTTAPTCLRPCPCQRPS